MANAYTPGLKVTAHARHRCRRLLPIAGDVLVQKGETVTAQQVVARTQMPGEATPLNVANILSMPAADVPECMLKSVGDPVEVGEVIARSKGLFGLFKSECKSKAAGTIENVSRVTGQVIIRGEPLAVEVKAFLAGAVTEVLPGEGVVIEADVSYVQGIFGVGGEAYGPIRMACAEYSQDLTPDLIFEDMRGQIVIGGARVHHDAIKRAIAVGASAVVSGGIDDHDLREILGYDLGVAVTGSEEIGITVIVTEGFGDIAMAVRTFDLFHDRKGAEAAVNGATQIRAGVMRPEIVIPLADAPAGEPAGQQKAGLLQKGTPIRIIRDPYFGLIGTVGELPNEPQVLGSGSKARVLTVNFDSGESATVPRANVELIEE